MSKNYLIDYNRILGRGATALVYIGIRKSDGELFALKCSHHNLKKEISICQDLNHKNIVKFYESVSKVDNFEKVLVMEYCNKGSLYDFIDIHKGLCDNMFLKTLECLSDGMQYLRAKDLIHRDIKPGNMMVHMDRMGDFHIKLGDMGAAKKVADDQMFQTLVGTEEYLHPDMYIRYIGGLNSEHSVHVDLWSIGVTLFHAAVTELPFLPYNYSRGNLCSKDVMKYMYSNMPKGVVWGRQKSNAMKDIEWYNELPIKCRISPMLKQLSAKLLALLFGRKISYDEFFDEANKILKKKRVLVFTPNNGLLQYLYFDLLTYENIMTEACRIQNLKSDELVLLTPSIRLEPAPDNMYEVVANTPVKGHLHYEMTENTLFIVPNTLDTYKNVAGGTNLISGSNISNYSEPLGYYKSTKERKMYSSELMKVIYKIDRRSNYVQCQIACYRAVMKTFTENIIMKTVKQIHDILPWQLKLIRSECNKSENLLQFLENVAAKHTNVIDNNVKEKFKADVNTLKLRIKEGESCENQYYDRIVGKREMIRFINREFSLLKESDGEKIDHMVHMAEELLSELKIYSEGEFGSDDEYVLKVWSRHIQQFKYYKQAKDHLVSQEDLAQKLHQLFNKWLKQSSSVMSRVTSLQDYLTRQEERRISLYNSYLTLQNQRDTIVNQLINDENNDELKTKFENQIIQEKMLKIKSEVETLKKSMKNPNS